MKTIKQTLLTGLIIVLIIGLLSVILLSSRRKKSPSVSSQNNQNTIVSRQPSPADTIQIIFFYGNTCPHCKDVEEWMNKNKIEQKIKITKKEVYDNKTNAQELLSAAKNCGLDTNMIGVPFLYAEGKCVIGTPDIINYLSNKIGL